MHVIRRWSTVDFDLWQQRYDFCLSEKLLETPSQMPHFSFLSLYDQKLFPSRDVSWRFSEKGSGLLLNETVRHMRLAGGVIF